MADREAYTGMTRPPQLAPLPLSDLDPGRLLGTALAGGGAHADVFLEDAAAISVRFEGGEVEAVSRDRRRGAALRVLTTAGHTRLATVTRVDASALAALAAELARAGSGGPARPVTNLGQPRRFETKVGVPPAETPLEVRIALASLADRVARGVSPAGKEVGVTVRDRVRRVALAASDGAVIEAVHTRAVVAIEVVAERDGVTQSAFEAVGGAGGMERIPAEQVEAVARLTAERAVRMLAARPAPAGRMPVVLAAEAGGTFVHEAVGHALEADAVLEGLSVFGDRLGEAIASPLITVVDDATLPGANGSFEVDDEGVLGERTVLVENGVLVRYLHDRRTALVMGAASGGKGRRESFQHRPLVRMTNTLILPGTDDPQAILRDTPSGLYVVRMGGGEVDTVTGQFVFEVNEAYLIENGAIGEAVRGATLTGDAESVLGSIDRVGRDLGYGIGTCGKSGQDVAVSDGEPTLRVPSLVVGGA